MSEQIDPIEYLKQHGYKNVVLGLCKPSEDIKFKTEQLVIIQLFGYAFCQIGKWMTNEINNLPEPSTFHRIHMLIGLAGELGELLDCIKKHLIYEKELDLKNLKEKLGDLLFYLEGFKPNYSVSDIWILINKLRGDWTIEELERDNILKLHKRFPTLRYTNKDAIERKDKVIIQNNEIGQIGRSLEFAEFKLNPLAEAFGQKAEEIVDYVSLPGDSSKRLDEQFNEIFGIKDNEQ